MALSGIGHSVEQVTLRRLLTLLLDRPQPVRLVLVGVLHRGRRHQPRAFLAEVIEAAPKLATGQCVLIVGPVGDRRRDVPPAVTAARWRQRSGSLRGTSARAIIGIALPIISRASPMLLLCSVKLDQSRFDKVGLAFSVTVVLFLKAFRFL